MNTERPDNDDATAADEAGAGRPARRRPPAVAVASVAAAVLLLGAGGGYLATSAAGDGTDGGTSSGASGDGTPPPLALDDHGASPGGGTNGIAPGEPDPYGVTYRADGSLPEGPGSAPVYRAEGDVGKAEVARLAEALDIGSAPRVQGDAWKAGNAKDGSGPLLTVDRQAPGTWSFHRYTPRTDNCKKGAECKAPSAGGSPVGEAAAKEAAAPVLKALGQDGARLDASQVMGAERAVNAEPEVGGLPTYGWTTGVVVGAQGEVVGGSGQVKAPVKGDTYPVLDAKETLALLNSPGSGSGTGGIGGCASPVPHQDGAGADVPCGLPTGAPGKSGGSSGDGKRAATVEDAVFGLAAHPVRGRQTLVPSWLFEVRMPGARDAVTVTYPAVEPEYLTAAAPASPAPSPSDGPSSDRPSSAPSKPRNVEVSGYTTAGGELTAHFTGGVCADYDAKARESDGKVTVTVTETPHPDKVCILIAKEYERTVRLDEPVGDREVVGADGERVPTHKPGARLPAPSGGR